MPNILLKNSASVDVSDLPSVPHVLLKLIDTCHDVDASFDDLARLIREDATLCTKILAVANTPTYAQWNGIKDFNRLLIVMGIKPIKSIAITAVVQQFFSQFDDVSGECMGLIWLQSLTCAHTAYKLAQLTRYPFEDEAYLAGLLHNLGRLVILKLHPNQYGLLLLQQVTEEEIEKAERELAGATSAEIASSLLEEWSSDSYVGDAIHFQSCSTDEVADANHLIKLLNISRKLTIEGFSDNNCALAANQLLGLNQALLDELEPSVASAVQDTAGEYGITIQAGFAPNIDNEDVRIEMARCVKGYALLQGALSDSNTMQRRERQWEEIANNLSVLFGLRSLINFEVDEAQGQLVSTAVFNARPLPESLSIKLSSERSLIALSTSAKRPLFSAIEEDDGRKATVIDQQLRRILNNEHFVALPIMDSETTFGVIAAGLSSSQAASLQKDLPILQSYLHAAAENLRQSDADQQRIQNDLAEQQAKHNAENRKLVHEANNPIGVIRNYLHALSRKLEDNQEVSKQLITVKNEIDRVADIISRMRNVGSPESESTELISTNINQQIRDLVSLYRSSIFKTHQIADRLELDDSIETLELKQSHFKQILTNLLKNATEAMPEGGEIRITTSNNVYVNGKLCVEIKIADNGPGVPDQILKNIFTPVKSTKGAGHSGLGLSIVHNLLEGMGGSISFQNQKTGGAEFTLHIPKLATDDR